LTQVFISHTKLDKEFCDRFDNACARIGVKAFRSEFETIKPPAWKTVRDAMNRSSAMFLLVGKQLVGMQERSMHDPETARDWRYTQNWIAYEIGLASQQGISVWVLCDDVMLNFPVPYFNHYQPFDVNIDWLRKILGVYARLGNVPSLLLPRYTTFEEPEFKSKPLSCLNDQCGMKFTFWAYYHTRPFEVPCPQCLQMMRFG